jgi:restriction system protein
VNRGAIGARVRDRSVDSKEVNRMDVNSRIRSAHRMPSAALRRPSRAVNSALPACPRCGAAMVLRIAWATQIGESFWGCRNYPRCHGTFKMDQV